jgi:hypothetical protein
MFKYEPHGTLTWLVMALAVSLGMSGHATANDSSAELAAGGLFLVKTDSISMQREDLALSPSEVRVRYEMRNDTGRPVTLRVAFPMPEVPKDTPGGMETKTAHNIAMQPVTDPNFLGFRVWANGQEVRPEVDIRATLPDGRDVTDAVRQIGGLPLVLHPRVFELSDEPSQKVGPNGGWDLDAAARRRLRDLGALDQASETYDLLWTTRITFHWMQTFLPGVTVLEHSYRPIIGGHVFEVVSGQSLNQFEIATYCIDAGSARAIQALATRLRQKQPDRYSGKSIVVTGYTLGYILQTARNWRGPIGIFHFTLQGGHVSTEYLGNGETRLMSLCTDLPLRQTAPMRFEATVHDYVPAQDLLVLILAE